MAISRPALPTFTYGEAASSAELTDLVTNVDYALSGPAIQLSRSADQLIGSGASERIAFNAPIWRPDAGMHSIVGGSNFAVTFPSAGLYHLQFQALWQYNATGYRQFTVAANGGGTIYDSSPATPIASLATPMSGSTYLHVGAGEFVEIYAYQTSGVSLNLLYLAGRSPKLTVAEVRA